MRSSLLTVTSPSTAANRRLCTLAAVRAELGITGVAEDAALDMLRDEASAAIAAWCGRTLAEEAVREVWRLDGAAGMLLLARRPVAGIATVTAAGAAIPPADHEHDPEAGMLWRLQADARVPWQAGKVVVDYTAGYRVPDQTDPTLPADISRAALVLVVALYRARGRDPLLRSVNIPDIGAESYLDPREGAEALPPQVAGLLERHREVPL